MDLEYELGKEARQQPSLWKCDGDRDGLTTLKLKDTAWIDRWMDRSEMVLVGASNQQQVASANRILTSLLKTSHRIRTVDLASHLAAVVVVADLLVRPRM